jgi:hypothetical protein
VSQTDVTRPVRALLWRPPEPHEQARRYLLAITRTEERHVLKFLRNIVILREVLRFLRRRRR